jgi:hypothetical protein
MLSTSAWGGRNDQGESSIRLGIETGTCRFREIVEPVLAKQLIQARIERMTRGCRELGRRHPNGGCRSRVRLPIAMHKV